MAEVILVWMGREVETSSADDLEWPHVVVEGDMIFMAMSLPF